MRRREDDLVAWRGDPVVQALLAPPTEEELGGIDGPLSALRANHPRPRSRNRLVGHVGTGVTTVVAALALTGGVAAAYTHTLPQPLQTTMHAIFGPLGVPAAAPLHPAPAAKASARVKAPHRPAPRAGTTGAAAGAGAVGASPVRAPSPATAARPTATAQPTAPPAATAPPSEAPSPAPTAAAAAPTPTASPSPAATAARPAKLTASAARLRVPFQQRTTLHGRLVTASGDPVAGHRVLLLQRSPGTSTWSQAAVGRTRSDGTVALRSPQLTRTVVLRLATPQGLHSTSFTVVVLPRINTTITLSPNHKRYVVTVTVTGAQTGNYVALARHDSSGWTTLHRVQLTDSMQETWSVPAPTNATVHYRVRVPRTEQHGEADVYFSVAPAAAQPSPQPSG